MRTCAAVTKSLDVVPTSKSPKLYVSPSLICITRNNGKNTQNVKKSASKFDWAMSQPTREQYACVRAEMLAQRPTRRQPMIANIKFTIDLLRLSWSWKFWLSLAPPTPIMKTQIAMRNAPMQSTRRNLYPYLQKKSMGVNTILDEKIIDITPGLTPLFATNAKLYTITNSVIIRIAALENVPIILSLQITYWSS